MATASLTEPHVLAHTKRRLFPDDAVARTYAVSDTQFAMDEWLPGHPISQDVREQLAPFNHVRLGSGYPDLVGVRRLDSDLLANSQTDGQPPLIAIEAKGLTGTGTVDIDRGIIQAYDRLHEANVVYLAAPTSALSQSARALARELNVGVLGVEPDGSIDPLEVPRIVGNRTSDDATAIRFQATAQGVANKSFGLNHPKNYLGVPLALYHSDNTDEILTEYVVRAVDDARRGAAFLGLIEDHPSGPILMALGEEVVRFALHRYGSVEDALACFEDWQRSQARFVDLAPEWGLLTRRVVWAYPATTRLVEALQSMHDAGIESPSLVEFVTWVHSEHPTFTIELFLRGTEDVRRRVMDEDGELQTEALTDGSVFHAPTVFQLKAMLYHAGILTERGAEPHRLDPTTDVWQLCNPL